MEHETSLKVASATAFDGASSAKLDPCVPVSSGLLLAVELSATSDPHVAFEHGERRSVTAVTATFSAAHGLGFIRLREFRWNA